MGFEAWGHFFTRVLPSSFWASGPMGPWAHGPLGPYSHLRWTRWAQMGTWALAYNSVHIGTRSSPLPGHIRMYPRGVYTGAKTTSADQIHSIDLIKTRADIEVAMLLSVDGASIWARGSEHVLCMHPQNQSANPPRGSGRACIWWTGRPSMLENLLPVFQETCFYLHVQVSYILTKSGLWHHAEDQKQAVRSWEIFSTFLVVLGHQMFCILETCTLSSSFWFSNHVFIEASFLASIRTDKCR